MSIQEENNQLQIIKNEPFILGLSKISVDEKYLKEWNVNLNDFVVLTKNGEILRNTLYRKGGLYQNFNVGVDKYFMLIKYFESKTSWEDIRKYYPNKSSKEQEKLRKHLESKFVIIDSYGNERVIFDGLHHGYLINNQAPIYRIDDKYYNIETGYLYCETHSKSIQSDNFLFLENKYDKDETKRGVIKISLKDGSWELFK